MSAGVSYTLGSLTLDQVDFIHNLPTSVLVAVTGGQVDLNRLAAEELTNRGYSRDGVWVGFVEAREQHLEFELAALGRDETGDLPPATSQAPARGERTPERGSAAI